MSDQDDLRAKILAAFSIKETDPDWIAFDEAVGPAEDEARARRAHFVDVELPRRMAEVAERMSQDLPPGLTVTWTLAPE